MSNLVLINNDIVKLLDQRTNEVDSLLCKLWHLKFGKNSSISLIATGGYGRAKLHPYSDIDVLILLPNNLSFDTEPIVKFIAQVWDAGFKISYSVHTLDTCVKAARADLVLVTSIMESRRLAGSSNLYDSLIQVTNYQKMWQPKAFFLAKRRELKQRHTRYADTEYNLEPNVKNSPGALRDIQTIKWVILRDQQNTNPLSAENQAKLDIAEQFLWQIRYALHTITGTNEERLLFPLQIEVAKMLGFSTDNKTNAVKQLMRKYYQTVSEVSVLSEIVLLSFAHKFLVKSRKNLIKPFKLESIKDKNLVNDAGFLQVNGDYLEFVNSDVIKKHPSLLLSIFVALAFNAKFKGITANTIEHIRSNLDLIDDDFRENPSNCALFLSLFDAKTGIHRNLRRMNRYGILRRYLPEFEAIAYQVQHDLFHIYTVDAHTLNLIKHLRKLKWPELTEKYSLASKLIDRITKPYILYLAGLLHDIGKNGQGNHSVIGAQIAENFCVRHNISTEDSNLIVWLVRNHLLLSLTAQKQDIYAQDVISSFADKVDSCERLDYLYLLTVADINATNPKLWNSWRASLLRKLYENTKNYLLNYQSKNIVNQQSITEQTLLLIDAGYHERAKRLWNNLDDNYLQSLSAQDLAFQTNAVLAHNFAQPLVVIRELNDYLYEGGTQIFIYLKDTKGIFATTTAVLAGLNLRVQEARIITSCDGFAWDTYLVLNAEGLAVEKQQLDNIKQKLSEALLDPGNTPCLMQYRLSPTVRYLVAHPIVRISNGIKQKLTQVDVITADRPITVATLGKIFMQFKLRIHHAKITTLGVKASDTFFISTYDGKPLFDPIMGEQLRQTIIKQLTI